MQTALTHAQFVRWRAAIFAIFAATGISMATWASRVPAIKEALHITKSEFGLMLVSSGVASIIGLSVASIIMLRFGARRAMLVLLLVAAGGVALIGLGSDVFHAVPVVALGLMLFGFGTGCVDVIMNVEGADIETHAGKTLLPMMHGFFSLGTFAGAGIGALVETVGVPVSIHTGLIAALIAVVAVVAVANVPAATDAETSPASDDKTDFGTRLRTALSAWKEPHVWAIGVIVLGMSFAEGSANDWLALGITDGHGADKSAGAIGLAVFAASMTVSRMVGGPIVDRFGRVPALRVLSTTAAAGLLLFIFAPNLPLVYVGAMLWGIGSSLGFPLGMSAASDDPARAASRVSAVATIGYLAFLAGPPLLGFLADQIGMLPTLGGIVGLIVISGLMSGAARPRTTERD